MFKILDEACCPQRATKYSAMVDLFAREDVVVGAGETKIVPLGVKIDHEKIDRIMDVDIPPTGKPHTAVRKWLKSHYLELHPRSSLRAKGLVVGVGVIDLDYPDEIGLIVHNPISHANNVTVGVKADTVSMTANLIGQGSGVEGRYVIKKGDKVAQCTLKEHKGCLMGYESDVVREGGFGSTDAKH